MTFEAKQWSDGESGKTPITADELNRIEQGITDAHAAADKARVPDKMSAADARNGTSKAARTIDAATLKAAVAAHTADLEKRLAAAEAVIRELTG